MKNENNANKNFDDLNDSISGWKKNINTALDKIKLDHEDNVKKVDPNLTKTIFFIIYIFKFN
jgi:hypothetical protein